MNEQVKDGIKLEVENPSWEQVKAVFDNLKQDDHFLLINRPEKDKPAMGMMYGVSRKNLVEMAFMLLEEAGLPKAVLMEIAPLLMLAARVGCMAKAAAVNDEDIN